MPTAYKEYKIDHLMPNIDSGDIKYRILYRWVGFNGLATIWETMVFNRDGYSYGKFLTEQEAINELLILKLSE